MPVLVRILIMAAAFVLALPVMAATKDEPSARERAAMDPNVASRQARRDLESLLEPGASFVQAWDIDVGMSKLHTKPMGTPIAGLCRRDELRIGYGETREAISPADSPPARALNLKVKQQFRATRDELGDGAKHGPFDTDCAGISGTGDKGWFEADDFYTAEVGYYTLRMAIAGLGLNRIKAFYCSRGKDESHCKAEFLEATNRNELVAIKTCKATQPVTCYEFWSDNYVTTIHSKNGSYDIDSVEISGINFVI